MGLSIVRILALGLGGLLILTGLAIVVATPLRRRCRAARAGFGWHRGRGGPGGADALPLRGRGTGRSGPGARGRESGAMDPRFAVTGEAIRRSHDGYTMRVFVDPKTGERRYRAED